MSSFIWLWKMIIIAGIHKWPKRSDMGSTSPVGVSAKSLQLNSEKVVKVGKEGRKEPEDHDICHDIVSSKHKNAVLVKPQQYGHLNKTCITRIAAKMSM